MFSKRLLRFTSTTVLGVLAAKYGVFNVGHIITLKPFTTDRNETIFHKIGFPKVHAINKEFIDELGRLKNDISLCIEREHLNPGHKYLDYLDHFIVYDTTKCVALYAFEHLTPNRLVAKPSMRMNLERAEPVPEPRLDEEFRVEPDEYDIRGKRGNKDCFVRGFMAAEGNHKEDYAYYNSTYFMPNFVPQVPKFNAQAWNHLEDFVRFLVYKYQDVYVISGSLWEYPAETKKVVKKTKIGKEGRIEVPTHYFKIIIVKERVTCDEVYHLYSYRLPNDKINVDKSKPYEECFAPYLYPVTDIEKSLGYSFFIVSPALIFHNIYPPIQIRPLPDCGLFEPFECKPAPCTIPPYVKPKPTTPEDPLPPPPESSVPNLDPDDDPTEPDDEEFPEPLGDDRYHHDDSDIHLDLDPHDYEDADEDNVYEFCDGGDYEPDNEPIGGTCSKNSSGACPLYMPPPCPPRKKRASKKCQDEDQDESQRKRPSNKGREEEPKKDRKFPKHEKSSQTFPSDPDSSSKPPPPKKRDPKEIPEDILKVALKYAPKDNKSGDEKVNKSEDEKVNNGKCKASKPPSDTATSTPKPKTDKESLPAPQSPAQEKPTNTKPEKPVGTEQQQNKAPDIEPKKCPAKPQQGASSKDSQKPKDEPEKSSKEESQKQTPKVPQKPRQPSGVMIFARSPVRPDKKTCSPPSEPPTQEPSSPKCPAQEPSSPQRTKTEASSSKCLKAKPIKEPSAPKKTDPLPVKAANVKISTGPRTSNSEPSTGTCASKSQPSGADDPYVPSLSDPSDSPLSSYSGAALSSPSNDNSATISGCSPSPKSYSVFGGAAPDYNPNSSPSARYTPPCGPPCGPPSCPPPCCVGGDSSNLFGLLDDSSNYSGGSSGYSSNSFDVCGDSNEDKPFDIQRYVYENPPCGNCPSYERPVDPPSNIPGNPDQNYPSIFG